MLALFYSGVGIIQRDAPKHGGSADANEVSQLEGNVQEIIAHFTAATADLLSMVKDLEENSQEEEEIGDLIRITRELDAVLEEKIKRAEEDLPLFKEHFEKLVDRTNGI